MSINALPSLRRKILKSFLGLVILYGILGVFLVIGVMISSGTSPKLIHVNYDSIQDSAIMRENWVKLRNPENYPGFSSSSATQGFESALLNEEGNITEPGEKEIAAGIRSLWDQHKKHGGPIDPENFSKMSALLTRLVEVNEAGMFGLALQNEQLSKKVLLGAVAYFLVSLLLSLLLADGLASRLSSPIKRMAEVLRGRPGLGKRLKLSEPTSLELLILNTELTRLWERVSEADQLNVQEIVRQKTKLEIVLESVEDALLVVDETGHVSQCNECMLTLLGLPAEKVKGFEWRDLPSVSESYLRLRALLGPDMPDSQEVELDLSGLKRQFSARARDIRGTSGRLGSIASLTSLTPKDVPVSRLYLLHDITEKRQREKFRAEFVDLLSHEIKTPLQSLGTATELLAAQKDSLPENLRLMVETISEDTERIRAVANEFVQVTQSQNKALRLKLEVLPLNQKLQEWMRPFVVVARDRQVRLRYEQQGSSVILANIDPVKFPWVVSNLTSNAVRFSPPGNEVVIFLTDRNGAIEIQVRDDGPGISEDDQRRMFDPFFQGTPNVMTTGSGAKGLFGIGLTIAKEVVEAHDGRIEYYPRKPHGSEFRIVLPFPTVDHR